MYENKNTEFKSKYVDSIKRTVIAFANTDGGTIYIGIEDDGTVCGVDDVDDVILRAAGAIRDSILPDMTLFTECGVKTGDGGKNIVYINVLRGSARPYYLAGKGIRPEGVFIRQGASTVPASQAAILDMIRETGGDSYEEGRALNQQLTFTDTENYFKKRDIAFGDNQKRTLNIIGNDGMYTNLGLLLSEQCVHTIKLAVFEGCGKSIFKERREFSGSLFKQLQEAFDYIDRFNRTRAEFEGLERRDFRDYPEAAVREALLNSIVHRDYSFSSSILINIYDDRMEFVSVGGLVGSITQKDIELGISILRNKYLANIFYRLELIEAYGTGILKIFECYNDYGIKPQIQVSDHGFKLTLPNVNYLKELTHLKPGIHMGPESITNIVREDALCNYSKSYPVYEERSAISGMLREDADVGGTYGITQREHMVLELFKSQPFIVRSDVELAVDVSQATAVVLLREMQRKGLLRKEGSGKKTKYFKIGM